MNQALYQDQYSGILQQLLGLFGDGGQYNGGGGDGFAYDADPGRGSPMGGWGGSRDGSYISEPFFDPESGKWGGGTRVYPNRQPAYMGPERGMMGGMGGRVSTKYGPGGSRYQPWDGNPDPFGGRIRRPQPMPGGMGNFPLPYGGGSDPWNGTSLSGLVGHGGGGHPGWKAYQRLQQFLPPPLSYKQAYQDQLLGVVGQGGNQPVQGPQFMDMALPTMPGGQPPQSQQGQIGAMPSGSPPAGHYWATRNGTWTAVPMAQGNAGAPTPVVGY